MIAKRSQLTTVLDEHLRDKLRESMPTVSDSLSEMHAKLREAYRILMRDDPDIARVMELIAEADNARHRMSLHLSRVEIAREAREGA